MSGGAADLGDAALEKAGRTGSTRALDAAGVLNAVVNDYRDYLSDPHVLATGMTQWIDHPQLGRAPITPAPGQRNFADGARHSMSPRLGEHSRAVLRDAGFGDAEIDGLLNAGHVVQSA